MIQVIRYIKGYVSIKVWGFSPERFMNLCSNHNIFLWEIKNNGDFYTMYISLKGFFKLKSICRKTGTRVAVMRRYGLPFITERMKKRKIFMAGLLGSFIFWMWMSGYIWAVEINGNYFLTTDIFEDFLVDSGIEAGMKKKALNIEELEKSIRNEFDIVTWTSAQVKGTRLIIQIKENDLISVEHEKQGIKSDEDVIEGGTDLTASKDGTIVSIITRSGVPKVAAQTEVKKGDLLVEGCIPIFNEDQTIKKYEYCKADADIMLQCNYELKDEIKEQYEKKSYTGRIKKNPFVMIHTQKFKLPLIGRAYEAFDVTEEKNQLHIFENYYFPVHFGQDIIREYTTETNTYSKDEVKSRFQEKINKFMQTLEEKGVQIIEKNVTIKKNVGIWKLDVVFTVTESTGTVQKTQEHILEQIPDPQEDIQE